jgi:hypothetical protein
LISSLLDPPGSSVGGRDVKGVSEVVAGGSEGFTEGVLLVVGLPGGSWGGVQAPPGLQRNLLLSWLGELEDASLFGNNCALVLGCKLGHQLGDKLANLLWVEVTVLLGHIDERCEDLVVALLYTFLENTSSSTDLDRELLTAGVSNELAGLLLHVLGCARGLVHGLANLGTLTVADLLDWCVALPHCLVEGLLLEVCDETFEKSCSITFKQQAFNETVRKCYRPTEKVCNGQGPEECRTVYEASCTTKYVEKQPGKFVGDTGCEKLPVEICGAGCVFEEGVEECHDKVLTSLVDVPEEHCDLNPQKICKFVTKLVPKLAPKHECTIVPKETCILKFTTPRQEDVPLQTRWRLDPTPAAPGESYDEENALGDPLGAASNNFEDSLDVPASYGASRRF